MAKRMTTVSNPTWRVPMPEAYDSSCKKRKWLSPPQDQKWSMPIRAAFHSRYHLTTTIQKLEADVFFKCVRVPTAQGTDLGIRKTALHGPASSPNAERVRFVQGAT